jgi:Phosphodiester glycosidase
VPIAPSALAATPLEVVSELESGGLRVRSGTLEPSVSAPGSVAAPWGFSELQLDPARVRLEVVLAPGGAPLEKLLPEGGLAVVNGGYFEADFRPSTWLVSGGVELAKKSNTSRGGVLALNGEQSYVGPLSGLRFEPSLAVQSFPLIVEPDGKPGIHRDDGRRAARTIACLVGARLHLILLSAPRGEGPTLFEAAGLLRAPPPRGFGCRTALNLDGGPSSGVWFSSQVGARQRAPLAHVAYALAVLPR